MPLLSFQKLSKLLLQGSKFRVPNKIIFMGASSFKDLPTVDSGTKIVMK